VRPFPLVVVMRSAKKTKQPVVSLSLGVRQTPAFQSMETTYLIYTVKIRIYFQSYFLQCNKYQWAHVALNFLKTRRISEHRPTNATN